MNEIMINLTPLRGNTASCTAVSLERQDFERDGVC